MCSSLAYDSDRFPRFMLPAVAEALVPAKNHTRRVESLVLQQVVQVETAL